MNKDSLATYYKDFPLKKPETRSTRHELDLYYAVMEAKIEYDRQGSGRIQSEPECLGSR